MLTTQLLQTYPGEIAALGSALSWSVAVICMRIGGLRVGSFAFNAFKASFATVCFLIVFPWTGLDWNYTLSPYDWGRLLLSGFLGIAVADFLFLVALRKLGAMLCAMLACFFPIFVMLCAWVFYGEVMSGMALVGTGIVLFAVLLCSYKQNNPLTDLSARDLWLGFLVGVAGEFFMAIAIIMIRDIYRETPVFWVITVRFVFASIIILPFVLLSTGLKDFRRTVLPDGAKRYVVLGSFFGPFLATIFWFLGYKYALAGKAATLNKLSTFFIFILAALFLKEPVTPRRVVAVVLAFIGAILVSQS